MAERVILISGATGAIGSSVVPFLLKDPGVKIKLLIRARSPEHLRERRQALLDFWELSGEHSPDARRIEAVEGDVTAPKLGLVPQLYDGLTQTVTHFLHAAGNVKLNQSLADARRSAVDSAAHAIQFARAAIARGAFEKLDYLSTVGVCGRMKGLIPERALTEARTFRNTYEEAKSEAEDLMRRKIADGLPATIHRPSMVVGDSSTGKIIHFQVFYHLMGFITGLRSGGVAPKTGSMRLDIIPSDYVARALCLAMERPETVGRTFHLCSGPKYAPTLSSLADQARAIFGRDGRSLPSLKKIPPRLIRAALPVLSFFSGEKARRMLDTLPLFLDYLEDDQVFDNAESDSYFSRNGIVVPPVETYLERLIAAFQSKTSKR